MTAGPRQDHDPRRPLPGAAQPRRPGVDAAALVVAAFLAVLAAVLFWDAAGLPANRGYAGIGPADTPRLVGGGLALLALWTVVEAFRGPPAEAPPRQDLPPVLWILLGLGLQLLLFRSAGFSIAGGLLFACAAAAFGRRRLWITVPVGIAFALAIFAVFRLVLDLSLPAGPLERLLFGL